MHHDMTPSPVIRGARRLRAAPNRPEQSAWLALRGLRRLGYPVQRQHPIAGVVVDFAIVRARCAIETDGRAHTLARMALADERRTARLRAAGWSVVRIPAKAAMDPDHVWSLVTARRKHPPLPSQGRGV